MLIYKRIIPFLIILIFLVSCSKKSDSSKDTLPPVITIISPLNNQQFAAGEIIQITVNTTDGDDKVIEMHIHVTNKTTGNLLRDIHSFPGQSNATVQDSFTAQAGITYTIKIIAKDAAQNLAIAKVEISTN